WRRAASSATRPAASTATSTDHPRTRPLIRPEGPAMRAQFVLSEIGVGLRRNLTMTFAVVVSVALSLALFGGSLLMSDQVTTMKGYWYDKVNVSIFLCNKSDAETDPNCAKGAVTE